MNVHATQAIDALGGTAAVARLFDVSMPSVSDWRKDGIPHARVMYLRAVHGQQLHGIDLGAATSHRKRHQAQQTPAVAAIETGAAHG